MLEAMRRMREAESARCEALRQALEAGMAARVSDEQERGEGDR